MLRERRKQSLLEIRLNNGGLHASGEVQRSFLRVHSLLRLVNSYSGSIERAEGAGGAATFYLSFALGAAIGTVLHTLAPELRFIAAVAR